jgi:hypothetical protein
LYAKTDGGSTKNKPIDSGRWTLQAIVTHRLLSVGLALYFLPHSIAAAE